MEPDDHTSLADRLRQIPYWLVMTVFLGLLLLGSILTNQSYHVIFTAIAAGMWAVSYTHLDVYKRQPV